MVSHSAADLCVMPPSPQVSDDIKSRFESLRASGDSFIASRLRFSERNRVGFNDGLFKPGTDLPLGTSAQAARRAATEARSQAPLRGNVRVLVVLVESDDKRQPSGSLDRFRELFFSRGKLRHGSVKEYFNEISNGLINLDGEVVGPYLLPKSMADYAGDENGTQLAKPNARTMANDALTAVAPDVDLAPYDNDHNGFVDAFIVVNPTKGAEATGESEDIWSHKWLLPRERTVDGTKTFAYLTIPENAKIGVCAHELGHLLFAWPDTYDTDMTSEGIGDWCLMAGGSWGLDGERPVHPSAWCKATQGWVTVENHTTNGNITVSDVKQSRTIHRLWRGGEAGNEYFLVENRMRTGYDTELPGDGLLVWHIDDDLDSNRDEHHYKIALVQADDRKDMEHGTNRGDAGDPYPGSATNTAFNTTTRPNSRSYAGLPTGVAINAIPTAAANMPVQIEVQPTVPQGVGPPSFTDEDIAAKVEALLAALRSEDLAHADGQTAGAGSTTNAERAALEAAVAAATTVYTSLRQR
jgi:immune inhibitor A